MGLAAQLLRRPDVLLLDEPTNNLDVDARAHGSTPRSTTSAGLLLVVSHDRVLLDRMDRIAELHRGEIVLLRRHFHRVRGPPSALRSKPPRPTSATPSSC